jgi:hypothetical protein
MADDTPAKSTPAPAASSDAPTNYSRGENQKSVTQTYRDNWDAIFGKPARKTTPARKQAAKKKAGVKKKAGPKKKPAAKKKTTAKKRKSKR